MSEALRLRGDEGYEVCDAVVTLRALRDAVRRELLRGLLLGPAAPRFSLSRFACAQRGSKPLRLHKPACGPYGPPVRLFRSAS